MSVQRVDVDSNSQETGMQSVPTFLTMHINFSNLEMNIQILA